MASSIPDENETTMFLTNEIIMAGKPQGAGGDSVPCYLGLHNDRILRIDAQTRTNLKTWRWGCVRGWVWDDKSFTLDVGEDTERCFLTTEGRRIDELFSMYVQKTGSSQVEEHYELYSYHDWLVVDKTQPPDPTPQVYARGLERH